MTLKRFAAVAASALTVAVGLPGCANTPSAPAEPVNIANTSWMLPIPKNSSCDVSPMLEFTANRVNGDLGCNRIFGDYAIEGNVITFGALGVTRRMCGPEYMKLEDTMLNAINKVKTLKREKDALIFLDENGRELIRLVPDKPGAC